jgi:hypothetical protein
VVDTIVPLLPFPGATSPNIATTVAAKEEVVFVRARVETGGGGGGANDNIRANAFTRQKPSSSHRKKTG